MGVKKIARPLNKSKNIFVKWLKNKNAKTVDIYKGESTNNWDYYTCVSAFVGKTLYVVYFTMWDGTIKIDYSDGENKYCYKSIDKFLELIKK